MKKNAMQLPALRPAQKEPDGRHWGIKHCIGWSNAEDCPDVALLLNALASGREEAIAEAIQHYGYAAVAAHWAYCERDEQLGRMTGGSARAAGIDIPTDWLVRIERGEMHLPHAIVAPGSVRSPKFSGGEIRQRRGVDYLSATSCSRFLRSVPATAAIA